MAEKDLRRFLKRENLPADSLRPIAASVTEAESAVAAN